MFVVERMRHFLLIFVESNSKSRGIVVATIYIVFIDAFFSMLYCNNAIATAKDTINEKINFARFLKKLFDEIDIYIYIFYVFLIIINYNRISSTI